MSEEFDRDLMSSVKEKKYQLSKDKLLEYSDKELETITELFFIMRFPDKNLKFEKECGYFYEWVNRFKSGSPENFMDSESLEVWRQMK